MQSRSRNVTNVYFHCSSDRGILIDQRGAAVDNLVAARDYAAGVVRSLVAANGAKDCRDWVLHVSDDLGIEIFIVPFAFVLGKPH
jgi:hypothetical protein